jgi:serine/threonine-protein kinase RsbW
MAARRTMARCFSSRLDEADRIALDARRLLGASGAGAAAFAVETCLRECLNNAVLHGNGGNPRRRVSCELAIGWKWIRFRVQDQGAGFSRRESRRPQPSTRATSGRGLRILDLYSRRVRFNRAGNAITVWIRRPAAPLCAS